MRTGTSGALSTLALILFCAGCVTKREPPEGFLVDVPSAAEPCGSYPLHLVATAIGGHKATLNSEGDAAIPEVRRLLREVLKTRAEKLVFVKAEADVTWGEFMELVDHVWPETDVVSILTPETEAMARRTYCLHPSPHSDYAKFGGFRLRAR
jgi:hypothetical protein